MQNRPAPELPSDLAHPALGVSPDGDAASDAAAHEEPMFDDPIIGWWENAWSLRDPAPGQNEPLV